MGMIDVFEEVFEQTKAPEDRDGAPTHSSGKSGPPASSANKDERNWEITKVTPCADPEESSSSVTVRHLEKGIVLNITVYDTMCLKLRDKDVLRLLGMKEDDDDRKGA